MKKIKEYVPCEQLISPTIARERERNQLLTGSSVCGTILPHISQTRFNSRKSQNLLSCLCYTQTILCADSRYFVEYFTYFYRSKTLYIFYTVHFTLHVSLAKEQSDITCNFPRTFQFCIPARGCISFYKHLSLEVSVNRYCNPVQTCYWPVL